METAKQKALEVVGREIRSTKSTTYLVIGCDTVVVHEGNILEKPSVCSSIGYNIMPNQLVMVG
jgi:predicted house-cleaning NTP pyrophosphatase (Maf/HAM1 superfamily)